MKHKEIVDIGNKLNEAYRQQKTCTHEWSEVFSSKEPYVEREYDYDNFGSDDIIPPSIYVTKYKKGWARTCNLCGKRQFTDKMKPDVVKNLPYFRE